MWPTLRTITEVVTGSPSAPGEGRNETTTERDVVQGRKWTSLQGALKALSTPAGAESVVSTSTQRPQKAAATAAAHSEGGLVEAASQLVSIVTSPFDNFTTSASDQNHLLSNTDLNLDKKLVNSDVSNELPKNAIKLLDKFAKENKNNVPFQSQGVTKLIPDAVESNYSTVISQISGTGPPSGFVASEPQSLIQPRTVTDLGLSLSQSGINLDNSNISSGKSRLHGTGFISSSLQYVDTRSPLTEGSIPDMENLYLDTPRPDSGLNGFNGLSHNTDAPYYLATFGFNYPSNVTERISALFDEESHSEDIGLAEYLWIYVAPIILIVGCIGNILILLVMAKGKFKGTTTYVYLGLMAVFDILVLLTGIIPEWLEAMNIVTIKEIHPVTCKVEKFVTYTVSDTAIWILVIFTIDRFIAVCFPLAKTEVCKPTRAKFYCLGLFLVAFTKNMHVFWTRGAEYKADNGSMTLKSNCGRPTPEYKFFEKFVRPWIVFALVSVLPFVVILICNISIIRALVRARKLHKGAKIQTSQEKTYTQMTAMCLSASFAFLCFITPSIVLVIGRPYWKDDPIYDIAKAIINQMTYVNHSINFFLYCITGHRFRQQLCKICKRERVHSPFSTSPYSQYESFDSRATLYRIAARPFTQNGFYRLTKIDKTNQQTVSVV